MYFIAPISAMQLKGHVDQLFPAMAFKHMPTRPKANLDVCFCLSVAFTFDVNLKLASWFHFWAAFKLVLKVSSSRGVALPYFQEGPTLAAKRMFEIIAEFCARAFFPSQIPSVIFGHGCADDTIPWKDVQDPCVLDLTT